MRAGGKYIILYRILTNVRPTGSVGRNADNLFYCIEGERPDGEGNFLDNQRI